jgi:hypothetical protein
VACQGVGGFLQFWDVAESKKQRTVQLRDPDAKKDSAYFYNFHVSPDGKHASALERVFSGAGSATRLACWDIATARPK